MFSYTALRVFLHVACYLSAVSVPNEIIKHKKEEELPTDHTPQSTIPDNASSQRNKVNIPSIFQLKSSGYNRVEQY